MPNITGKVYKIGSMPTGLRIIARVDGSFHVAFFDDESIAFAVERASLVELSEAFTDFVDTVAVDE